LDIKVDKNSVNFKKLRNKFIDLYSLRYDWMRELVTETGKTDNDLSITAQEKLKLELFPELINSPIIENYAPEPNEPYRISTPTNSEQISNCAKKYYDRKKVEGVREKGIKSDISMIDEFVEIVGDISFASITKKEVSHYIDVQTKLPSNRLKKVGYRDLTIKEVLELNLTQKETQTPQNINKRIGKLSVFANWGVRQGLLNNNPFSGMKFLLKKQPNKRQPFNNKDLRIILNPETYFKWTIDFEHPFRKGRVINNLPYYWIFLVGILSGMRTNEIAQLRT